MKKCPRCKQPKSLEDFGNCAVFPNGKTYECRECHNKFRREWSKKNRTKSADAARRYRKANPKFCLFVSAKHRAKKSCRPFSIIRNDIVIPDICPVLGIRLLKSVNKYSADSSPSLDAIIPELGYIPGNIAVISHRANTIKTNATPEELRKVANWLEGKMQSASPLQEVKQTPQLRTGSL